MARPLRIEYDGALYHVTSRGNERKPIFRDDADRKLFLNTLSQVTDRFHWLCHAYCLMGNHYHLLLETPEPTLSRGMRQLAGEYTQAFNRRHGRVGHLFHREFRLREERDLLIGAASSSWALFDVRALAPDDAEKAIKELTSGGAEITYEAAGVPAVLEAAFRAARRGGTTVAMGLPHPSRTLSLQALAFAGLGQSLVGSYMGSASPQRDIPRYLALWKKGRMPVDRLQSAVLPLSRINEAFEKLAAGEAVRQVLLPQS